MSAFVSPFDRLVTLKGFEGFAPLHPSELLSLAARTRARSLVPGAVLVAEGEVSGAMFFLIEGAVVGRAGDRVVRRFGPRDVVGGISAFARQPMAYALVVDEPTVALELAHGDAVAIYESSFAVLSAVMQALARASLDERRKAGPAAGFSGEIRAPVEVGEPPSTFEKMRLFHESMPFARDSLSALTELSQAAFSVSFAAGERLWAEGDAGGYMLLLLDGIVDAETSSGQRFSFGPRDVVGTLDSGAGLSRWFTARARAPLRALRLDRGPMLDVYEEHVEVPLALLQLFARSLLKLQEDRLLGRSQP